MVTGLSKRFPPSPDYNEPVPTSASGFRNDPVLETDVIFALPQLQLKLVTEHVQAVSEPSAPDAKPPPVVCSFLAEVLHPVCITVDVEAIEFVREVILGYINEFKKGAPNAIHPCTVLWALTRTHCFGSITRLPRGCSSNSACRKSRAL